MLPSEALEQMDKDIIRIVDEVAQGLLHQLMTPPPMGTPVDTGQLRSAWDLKATGRYSWVLSNNMEYADVIFDGRRLVAGRYYGSEQMPSGIMPVLEKWNMILQDKMDKLKY